MGKITAGNKDTGCPSLQQRCCGAIQALGQRFDVRRAATSALRAGWFGLQTHLANYCRNSSKPRSTVMGSQGLFHRRTLGCRANWWMINVLMLVAWAWSGLASQAAAQEATPDEQAPAEAKDEESRKPIYDPKANAREQIDAALKTAKRDNKRVLLKFGGIWCGWCYKLHDVFTKHEIIAPLVDDEFVLVMIDVDAHRELFESYGKDNAKHGFPFLTVLDAEGKLLVNQNTGDLEDGPQHDPKKVEEFLRKWVATKKHANEVLKQALAEARKSDKRVLLHLGAPWCGWCHRLTDLLAELEEQLSRDYVIVKIDTARMTEGEALEEKLRKHEAKSPSGGIPWMVVLDADGKQLITSDATKGNIGCPVLDWEIEHFMRMLEKTRKVTGNDDLARLRAKIEKVTEKWRPQ
jgi:thiol-disulfide isomerase/thioredoxin